LGSEESLSRSTEEAAIGGDVAARGSEAGSVARAGAGTVAGAWFMATARAGRRTPNGGWGELNRSFSKKFQALVDRGEKAWA